MRFPFRIQPDTSPYNVTLPFGTLDIPELFPVVRIPMSLPASTRPVIFRGVKKKTTTFTLTSGDGLELLSYKVLLTIAAGGNTAGISNIRSQDYFISEGSQDCNNLWSNTGTTVTDFFNRIIKEDQGQGLRSIVFLTDQSGRREKRVADQDTPIATSANGQKTTQYLIIVHEGGACSMQSFPVHLTVTTDTLAGPERSRVWIIKQPLSSARPSLT